MQAKLNLNINGLHILGILNNIYYFCLMEIRSKKMNLKQCIVTLSIASVLLSPLASAEIFKNQRGSILEFNILDDNKIDGYFTTAVASKSCPDAIN